MSRAADFPMNRRHISLTILALIVIFVLAAIHSFKVPVWRDQPAIESWVRSQIPLGTPVTSARSQIRSHGWKIESEWAQNQPMPSYGTAQGTHVIHAALGSYWFGSYWLIFSTDYDAFFGFDNTGNLVEVRVRKMVDAL